MHGKVGHHCDATGERNGVVPELFLDVVDALNPFLRELLGNLGHRLERDNRGLRGVLSALNALDGDRWTEMNLDSFVYIYLYALYRMYH